MTTNSTDTVIRVDHLHKSYNDVVAVQDVSFEVQRGEVFGLLGPNGAGKTTTVEALQGLRRRDGGVVEVLGLDPVADAARLRSRIGSQLQSAALPDRLRVGEAVALFARLHSSSVDVEGVLADWNLTELRRRVFANLSGGQRQRLFLALALLGEPEVVFLDELTAALDPVARRATWELVRQVRDRGATIVLVTHFMEEAEALCDRVAVVDGGQVVAMGTPAELSAQAGGGVSVTFSINGTDPGFLSKIPGVTSVTVDAGSVTVTGEVSAPVRIAAGLASHDLAPDDFRTHHPTLEDVFLTLTGRSLSSSTPREA